MNDTVPVSYRIGYSSYIYSDVGTVYLDFHVFPWPRFTLPFPDLKNKLYCVTKFFEQKQFYMQKHFRY
jgi:hypothetical protein